MKADYSICRDGSHVEWRSGGRRVTRYVILHPHPAPRHPLCLSACRCRGKKAVNLTEGGCGPPCPSNTHILQVPVLVQPYSPRGTWPTCHPRTATPQWIPREWPLRQSWDVFMS